MSSLVSVMSSCTACCKLAVNIQLHNRLGWTPSSLLKNVRRFPKDLNCQLNQVCEEPAEVEEQVPLVTVEIGPEIKTDFPQLFKDEKIGQYNPFWSAQTVDALYRMITWRSSWEFNQDYWDSDSREAVSDCVEKMDVFDYQISYY